jgi:hypothetical protein
LPHSKNKKKLQRKKIEENQPDMHQVLRRGKEKEEKRGQWLDFSR